MLYYHNSYYVETPKGLNALTLDQVGGGVVVSGIRIVAHKDRIPIRDRSARFSLSGNVSNISIVFFKV